MAEICLFGENAEAYMDRSEEILLYGGAGSGKTATLLSKCLTLLDIPRTRGLLVRKTRASLSQSGLLTFERDILGFNHPVLMKNPNLRETRKTYRFANGSEFVVAGMDKPQKILSSDYDFVYFMEANEFTIEDWETVSTRLRTGRTPFRQMMACCNPTSPTHWLYKRMQNGRIRFYKSRHEDNPRYWNRKTGRWTKEGEEYMRRLRRQTGARRSRYYHGEWKAAEGLVYDNYDEQIHLLRAGWEPPAWWPRVWGIDHGFRNPAVLQFWAIDPEYRMYLYREIYQTGVRIETIARWARKEIEEGREPRPIAAVADHDPDKAATFHKYSTVPVTPAIKLNKEVGIQQLQGRFDLADDNRPRIYIKPGALSSLTLPNGEEIPARDETRAERGLPLGLQEELVQYVWDTRDPEKVVDKPLEKENHSCFVAGTIIETVDSLTPIEDIVPGDVVLTRQGLRKVVAAGQTATASQLIRLDTSDGRVLLGTANHPVFVVDDGFVPLGDIEPGMTLVTVARGCCRWRVEKVLSTGETIRYWKYDQRRRPYYLAPVITSTVQARAVTAVTSNEPVYNLTVEGEHEYFANGILVHNCDSGLYVSRWLDSWLGGSDKENLRDTGDPELQRRREEAKSWFRKY